MRATRLTGLLERIRSVLRREDGSLAESVASVVLITLIASTLAMTAVNDMNVIGVSTATSERQNKINAIVGQHNNTNVNWGTAAAPVTKDVTLGSGVTTKVTTWSTTNSTGTSYYASIARTGNVTNPATCQSSSATDSPSCLVATQFSSRTITTIIPSAVVRKDPSGVGTTGSVAAAVATPTPIAQDGQIASFTPAGTAATVNYGFLLKAQDAQSGTGSIRIVQGGNILASIPTDDTMHDYYGTIVSKPGVPVTVAVGVDAHVVTTILIYQAG